MNRRIAVLAVSGWIVLVHQTTCAQGYGERLTMQGVEHTSRASVASRAAGGIIISRQGDLGLMFANPAAMHSISGIQLSLGGYYQNTSSSQAQQYAPLKYYSNFSLLMEGLTGRIPNPRFDSTAGDPGDSVQRPFDALPPHWSRSTSRSAPLQAMLGVPFSMGEMKFVGGVGFAEYANLNNYYRNNNVLSPGIGSDRPVPVQLPPSDSTPVVANWSAFSRLRNGKMHGYGLALSSELSDKIVVGLSGMMLRGSSDDYQEAIGRGRLTFYRQTYFRLDSVYSRVIAGGTSDFKGNEFTFSGLYRGSYVRAGFAVKPPTTITRTYDMILNVDSTGLSSSSRIAGEDRVRLPWRGTVGLSIMPFDGLTFGLEYELRSYASAVYTSNVGAESHPWLSASQAHIGVEYRAAPWLAIRAGMRGQSEVFEQTGNPLPGEEVRATIYSAGFGLAYAGIRFDMAYEYVATRYNDNWQTNVNLNKSTTNKFSANISYEMSLPE